LARRLEIDYNGWFDHKRLRNAAQRLANDTESVFAEELPISRDASIHTWASNQVEKFLSALKVSETPLWDGGPHIGLPVDAWHEVQILKFITKHYVIQHPDMALLQRGQESILTQLVSMVLNWNKHDQKRLPERLLSDIEIAKRLAADLALRGYEEGQFARGPYVNRAFVDYVCNLTDEECSSVFRKLSGISVHQPFGYAR
jgi:dGTPase